MRFVIYSPFGAGLPNNSVRAPHVEFHTSVMTEEGVEKLSIAPGINGLEDEYPQKGFESFLEKKVRENDMLMYSLEYEGDPKLVTASHFTPDQAKEIVRRLLIIEDIRKFTEGSKSKIVLEMAKRRIEDLEQFNRKKEES